MGNTNCKTVLTNYIVTNDPYYKLHYLVTIVLFALLYFNYLKDEEFIEYEDRFVVFASKYILMPLIIGSVISTIFYYIVQLWQRKLIAKAVSKCRGAKGDDLTDMDLKNMTNDAYKEVSTPRYFLNF
jgi:hypothetical protein|uniref:Uncharacterized protein n=1 Tax=viral metagenome TaxID=1070528 RepID=A0A6C0H0Z1_9ZZZZ